MANFNSNTSKFLFIDGDTNSDGVIDLKDVRRCPAIDVAAEIQSLIDTDTNVTYTFGSIVDSNPNDGQKKLVLNGSDGSTTCVLIPDSSELLDIDTTYTLQVIDETLTLIGSDGSISGGDVFIQTYDEDLVANADGSYTFTDDDGGTVTIARPLTADEMCQAVLGSLSLNAAKLLAYQTLINAPIQAKCEALEARVVELEQCVEDLKSIDGV